MKAAGKVAGATEPYVRLRRFRREHPAGPDQRIDNEELVARSVAEITQRVRPVGVVVPTETGATVRRVCRYRLPVMITAVSHHERTCRQLQLSYGVQAVRIEASPQCWYEPIREHFRDRGITEGRVLLTEGSGSGKGTNRLEIIDL